MAGVGGGGDDSDSAETARTKPDLESLVSSYKSWAFHPEVEYMRDLVGERPQYVCNTCGKTYQWKQGLNTHKRLHCGKEPRFQCPHCPKKCYQRGNLESHIRNVHSGLVQNNGLGLALSALSGSGMQIIRRGPVATSSFTSSI
nr:PREDICTED: longitudinals lacking protein-like [Bemisia tabaci]